MFKIFRKNCCGLDVYKTWIYACIGITDTNGRTEYKQARFSSFSKGLRELSEWLAKYSCTEVCMESSGKYILSKLEPYTPDGFLQDCPADGAKTLTKSQALALFKKRGYTIIDDPVVS